MNTHLVITLIANDRPGIVEQVAQVISEHEGNWLESSLSRLGGKFAGILLVAVENDREEPLRQALSGLQAQDIRAVVEQAGDSTTSEGQHLLLSVVGNDRRGIVGEISRVLASRDVNVDELYTSTENAPMSGDVLFRVTADIVLPSALNEDSLRIALEELSDDLMVELDEPGDE